MQYFTLDTDRAIQRFVASTEDTVKHKIFAEEIQPAFEKLIESLIYVYRFYTLGDVDTLKRECLTALYQVVEKFDITKSNDPNKKTSKAFSYFNMVAKNWFIARSRENARAKSRNESDLLFDLDHEALRNDPNLVIASYQDVLEDQERWVEFYKAMDSWKSDVKKDNERVVLESVNFLLRNAEMVHIYSKKAVFIYLRDMTGLNSKQIVTALKKIKSLYDVWVEKYNSGEIGNVKGGRAAEGDHR